MYGLDAELMQGLGRIGSKSLGKIARSYLGSIHF